MATPRFSEQMQAFEHWKEDLAEAIRRYQQWLEANSLGGAEDELRIFEIVDALRSDRLTIAFVAEFARGKTELINAIFFSDYDRRLLPSAAGRTTMCPTELFYDNSQQEAYIRLLPIETRLHDKSIAEFKLEPIHWTSIRLQLDSPDSMAEAFQEVVRVKTVSLEAARRLGLYRNGDALPQGPDNREPEEVEIPLWRHALISFPHPLLKQGLVILDTPGLNALGSEPELTINMLPNAQAVVFVLAADTGVTQSDLQMWQHNVTSLRNAKQAGLMVALNKVDTLWDELKSAEAIEQSVTGQCRKVAQVLGIGVDKVFPVSAQKGLLARIRHDDALLERSNIAALESTLATSILPHKQALVRQQVVAEIGAIIRSSQDLLASRLAAVNKQLEELRGLSGKNNAVIDHLMKKTREEQIAYFRNVESFQANKRLLSQQSKKLMELLSLTALDDLVSATRHAMNQSWTTHGLKSGMTTFFSGAGDKMAEVADYTEQMNRLVVTVFRKFHQEHGIGDLKPTLYSASKHMRDFAQLQQDAEAFRNSPVTTMTEQSFVIKKFFISLVSQARNIFFKMHREAEQWSKAVMLPLVRQIKEHKEQMEQRLENLRRINESRDTLQTRMDELAIAAAALEQQAGEIRSILTTINRPLSSANRTATPARRQAATG